MRTHHTSGELLNTVALKTSCSVMDTIHFQVTDCGSADLSTASLSMAIIAHWISHHVELPILATVGSLLAAAGTMVDTGSSTYCAGT